MRALILAGLIVAATPALAQSDAAACREIQDSLLRLRCYDDLAKPAAAKPVAPAPSAAKDPEPDFSRYRADVYRGRIQMPDFNNRDRAYAIIRTRLRQGAKSGPNFAGHLTLVQIGCGASCSSVHVIDSRTGRVSDFPLGGEDNLSLVMRYQPDSRLIVAYWVNEGCVGAKTSCGRETDSSGERRGSLAT